METKMLNENETDSAKTAATSSSRDTDCKFFFEKLGDDKFDIPHWYDKEPWQVDKMYRISVAHIYDPSHFWIIVKNGELDLFQEYLSYFYTKNKEEYRIPTDNLKLNVFCACYDGDSFYRGKLLNVGRLKDNKVLAFVYLIDFGYMAKIPLDDLYFLTKKMYTVPRFAVRACLSGLAPSNSNHWSLEAVKKFGIAAYNKIVFAELIHKNDVNRLVYLRMADFDKNSEQFESIDDHLVSEEVARLLTNADIKNIEDKSMQKDTDQKLAFLRPSFHEIETNQVTDCFSAALMLQEYYNHDDDSD